MSIINVDLPWPHLPIFGNDCAKLCVAVAEHDPQAISLSRWQCNDFILPLYRQKILLVYPYSFKAMTPVRICREYTVWRGGALTCPRPPLLIIILLIFTKGGNSHAVFVESLNRFLLDHLFTETEGSYVICGPETTIVAKPRATRQGNVLPESCQVLLPHKTFPASLQLTLCSRSFLQISCLYLLIIDQ